LRSVFTSYPDLLTPVVRIRHRAIHTHRIKQPGVKPDEAASGASPWFSALGQCQT